MIYRLRDGTTIDTARECSFEERNFLQKMIIFQHMKMDPQKFRARWRTPDNPAWRGEQGLSNPSPALRILLDMEKRLQQGAG